jgi:hypothetical protein
VQRGILAPGDDGFSWGARADDLNRLFTETRQASEAVGASA